MFERALEIAKASQTSELSWKGTYLNLGQAYRKLECVSSIHIFIAIDLNDRSRFEEAKGAYEKVITIDPRNAQGYACLGMIHHVTGELDEAITRYHQVCPSLIETHSSTDHIFS